MVPPATLAGLLALAAPAPQPPQCLPAPRQGAAAVVWRGAILLVGGSTSPGKCHPPYTEWPTIYTTAPRPAATPSPPGARNSNTTHTQLSTDAAHPAAPSMPPPGLRWRRFESSLPSGRTHAAAAVVADTLFVFGGYGTGDLPRS